jgi:hypothetical protein
MGGIRLFCSRPPDTHYETTDPKEPVGSGTEASKPAARRVLMSRGGLLAFGAPWLYGMTFAPPLQARQTYGGMAEVQLCFTPWNSSLTLSVTGKSHRSSRWNAY